MSEQQKSKPTNKRQSDNNVSIKQEQQSPNPFSYLYRMKYQNPSIKLPPLSLQEVQGINDAQKSNDFFLRKLDQKLHINDDPPKQKRVMNSTSCDNRGYSNPPTSRLQISQSVRTLPKGINQSSVNTFNQTWRQQDSREGFFTQRSQIQLEKYDDTYSTWNQANLALNNNKMFYNEITNDLKEFQNEKYRQTMADFKKDIIKIQGMPLIRVIKKQKNNQNAAKLSYEKRLSFQDKEPLKIQQRQIFMSPLSGTNIQGYWEKIQALKWSPDAREGATMITIGSKIYLFGGMSINLHSDVQILNTNNWRWLKPQDFKVKHSPGPRYNHSAVLYTDHIIIFGGQQSYNTQTKLRNTLNDLLIFNTQTYDWEQIHYGGMFFSRKNHIAAVVAQHMLLYGGLNEEGIFESGLLALNLGTFKWLPCQTEGDDPGKIIHSACCSIIHPDRANKKSFSLFKNPSDMKYRQFSRIKHEGMYIFGGQRDDGFASNSLHVLRVGCRPLQWFQPETQGMTPTARYGHMMNYIQNMNCIVIFGGRNDTLLERQSHFQENFFNDLWLLNLENLSWCKVTSIGDIPSPRYFCTSEIVGSKLVIFGGLNQKTYNTADIFICELDPMLTKQYEAEGNKKILEFKKKLNKNKYNDADSQQSTAQILQKYFGSRINNKKQPLPINLITYLENRHQALEKQKEEEKRKKQFAAIMQPSVSIISENQDEEHSQLQDIKLSTRQDIDSFDNSIVHVLAKQNTDNQ